MSDHTPDRHPRIIIRPLSAVIYLYPSLIAAIVCGLIVQLGDASPANPGMTGIVFTLVFFFNLTVVAFDYTRLSSVVIILLVVIFILLSVIYPPGGAFFQDMLSQPMFMNATFYWVWSSGIALVLAGVLIKARFDYWEVKNNELLHHHGLLGDVERWPAPNMRMTKEIKDVMEYLLCRAGRLVLIPASERRAIILDNIVGITKVEHRMQNVLNTLLVNDTTDAHGDG